MEGVKGLRVRNLLRGWKADVVCFQETKLRLCFAVLCIVCEVAIMWIGVV
jgi:hypothetical protein